jgi:formate dehydrogenase major subunit
MLRRTLKLLAAPLASWPAARQLVGALGGSGFDSAGEPGGDVAMTDRSRALHSRLHGARTTASVCPYCAVGCGTLIHSRHGAVLDVEGNPDSPINAGTLCPKGAGIFQYTVNPKRLTRVLYRRPYGTEWERVGLDWAMDRIAERVADTRERTWVARDEAGRRVGHTDGIGFLGGAALDNEENYLIKKLCVGAGIVHVENQARI